MPPKLVVQGVAIRAAHRPHLLPSGCWTARSGSSWHCWQGRHVGWCRGTPGYLIHPELDNIHHHIHIYLRSGGQDLSGRQPARLLREVEWPQSSPDCNSLDYLMWGGGHIRGPSTDPPTTLSMKAAVIDRFAAMSCADMTCTCSRFRFRIECVIQVECDFIEWMT